MTNLLLLGPVFQADTLVLGAPPVGLERWAAISVIAIAIFLAFVIVALALALFEVRRLTRKVSEAITRIEPGVHPVLERARGVTENVERITGLVRKDVDRVTESVQAVTGRLNQAAARMEERIEEFNAVVEVVQSEAEGIFLDTASTARGVRAGALSLGAGRLRHEAADIADLGDVASDLAADTGAETASDGAADPGHHEASTESERVRNRAVTEPQTAKVEQEAGD